MRGRYNKGANAERELIKLLWDKGWATVRTPRSGVSRYPCPDLIAGNGPRKIALECKKWVSKIIYLDYKEALDLLDFSKRFGCEAYIAIRKKKWYFYDVKSLEATRKGNFKLDTTKKTLAKDIGELIGEYKQERLH